jgi:thymidylate synthase (FAD)
MLIVEPNATIMYPEDWDAELRRIERAARTCYQSEGDDPGGMFEKLYTRGHHAMLEFGHMTVRFVCDRGVSHELVRHRLCSFAQESTRYVNYNKRMTVVRPSTFSSWPVIIQESWEGAMLNCEIVYDRMIRDGLPPQEARAVLPTCLKTEIVVDANLREWLHIIELRYSKKAHPDMRHLMGLLVPQLPTWMVRTSSL